MSNKYRIVAQALKNVKMDSYLESFKDHVVDEIDHLKDLIPKLGERIKFFNEFKKIINHESQMHHSMSMSQVKIVKPVPSNSVKPAAESPKLKENPSSELPILEMTSGSSLMINFETLSKILDQIGKENVIILGVVGETNMGKSFILRNIFKYFESQGMSNPNEFVPRWQEEMEENFVNPTLISKLIHFQDFRVMFVDIRSNNFTKNTLSLIEKMILLISSSFIYTTSKPRKKTNVRLSNFLKYFEKHLNEHCPTKFTTLVLDQKINTGLNSNLFGQGSDAYFLPILAQNFKNPETVLPKRFKGKLVEFLKIISKFENVQRFKTGFQVKKMIQKYAECLNKSEDISEVFKNLEIEQNVSIGDSKFEEIFNESGSIEDNLEISNLALENDSDASEYFSKSSKSSSRSLDTRSSNYSTESISASEEKDLNSKVGNSMTNDVRKIDWNQITELFLTKFSTSVKLENMNNGSNESELKMVIEDKKNIIFNDFIANYQKESNCLENFQILKEKIAIKSEEISTIISIEKSKLIKTVQESIQKCLILFESDLKSELGKFSFVSEDFFLQDEISKNPKSIFSKYVQNGGEELYKKCDPEISQKLNLLISKYEHENRELIKLYKTQLNKILENSLLKYSQEMDKFTHKTLFEPAELNNAQMEIRARIMDEFLNHKIFENLMPSTKENYKHELELKLNDKYSKDEVLYLEKQRIIKERLERSLEVCKIFYIDKLHNILNERILSTEDLEIFEKNCSTEAKIKFKEKMADCLEKVPENIIQDLENKMKKKFKKIKVENSNKREQAKLKAEIAIGNETRNYDERMTSYISKEHLKERKLLELHKKETQKCLQNFAKCCPKGLSTSEFEPDLIKRIDKVFETILDVNLLRKEDDEAFKNKVDHYVKLYSQDMGTFFQNKPMLTSEELGIFHRNLKIRIMKISDEEYSFEMGKRDILRKALDLKFKYFEDLNFMNHPVKPAVGIDLGTTYSCIGIYNNNRMKIIENWIGKETTPSYVQFCEDDRISVGEPAKSTAYLNPENTIFDSKRLIGKNYDDPKVQGYFPYWPFQVIRGDGNTPLISVMGIHKEFRPEEISSLILKHLKDVANKYLGLVEDYVLDAVITVPYYFTDRQRQATKDAGALADMSMCEEFGNDVFPTITMSKISHNQINSQTFVPTIFRISSLLRSKGLNVLRIINEPTAASIAYRLEYVQDERILVFDLGGGTFDVSLLRIKSGDIIVEAADGDTQLGGQDFDNRMIRHCLEEFKKTTGVDISEEIKSRDKDLKDQAKNCMARLRAECERKKWELSQIESTRINIPRVFQHHDIYVEFSRETFENINADAFKRTIEIVERTLTKAHIGREDINEIVLVGGSTRIPKIQALLQEFFGGRQLKFSLRPDQVVAEGAAIMAALISGGGGAKGAKLADFKVNDVTPHSLGIELENETFSVIIKQNSRVPVTFTKVYTTVVDDQATALITIYEGENEIAKENNHLGLFIIEDIPPGPLGSEWINVKMEIDKEGILKVSAKNRDNTREITLREYRNRMPE